MWIIADFCSLLNLIASFLCTHNKFVGTTAAPYYGSSTADGLQDQILYQSDEEDQAQTEASAELYKRIQVLTDQVHSKMDTMKELDTLSSNQSTPVPTEEQPYRNLTHELNTHSESNIFTTERRASAIKFNEGKEKSYFDLVLGLDNEDGVPSIINRDSTLTAEPEPSITSMDPKMKKAIEKMKKLDEKLVDLDKVRIYSMSTYRECIMYSCK